METDWKNRPELADALTDSANDKSVSEETLACQKLLQLKLPSEGRGTAVPQLRRRGRPRKRTVIQKRPWLYLSASSSSVESSTVNRPDTSLLAESLERSYPEEEPASRERQRGSTGRRRKQRVDSDDLPLSVRIPRTESSRERWKQQLDSDRDSDLPRMAWSAHSEIDRNWSETDQLFEPVHDLQIPHKSDHGRSQSTCARTDDVLSSFSATAKSRKRSKSCRRILDSPEDRMAS